MALVMAAVVVLSFPVTYFVPVATGSGKFHALHHVHALASFAWFGLYVWQTQLVARGHIARHREIGLAGFALTGAMILLGYWMAQRGAERRLGTMCKPASNFDQRPASNVDDVKVRQAVDSHREMSLEPWSVFDAC